jgi:integrase
MTSSGKVVRRQLADGSVKEYRYPRAKAGKDKPPRIAPGSLDALLEAWRRSPEWADLAHSTQVNYGIYLRDLYRLGRSPASAVRRKDVIALRNAIAHTRGRGAATGFLRAVSAAYAWGMENDLVESNPAYRIKPLRRGTLPTWTEEVLRVALDKLPEAYRRAVLLAVYTLQRRGDLLALPWSAYDGRSLRLTQEKTREPLVIAVHRDLKVELDRWQQEWRQDGMRRTTILAAPSGLPWTAAHFTRELGRLVGELGLGRFTPHGLRKLGAVRAAEAGCSAHQIMALGGWRSLSMVQHYTKAAEQEGMATAAIIRLEKAGRGKPGKRSVRS